MSAHDITIEELGGNNILYVKGTSYKLGLVQKSRSGVTTPKTMVFYVLSPFSTVFLFLSSPSPYLTGTSVVIHCLCDSKLIK